MSNFTIRQATRTGVVPLIGLYSESGCGKTYSSLLLARGIAGPNGQLVMLDTESRRGSLYADVIPGGFDVLDLEPPFSPKRYREAIAAIVASKPAAMVVDSASHEWEGDGGVLNMADEIESKSGKPGLHCWKVPKLEHGRLMLDLLRLEIPCVVCVRAKYKTKQVKVGEPPASAMGRHFSGAVIDKRKTEIVKDDHTSPIQAADFIFELTAHMEILQDHTVHVTKCSHPDLRKCFPADGQGPITIEHGAAVARWCSGGGAKPAASKPATTAKSNNAKEIKAQLWSMLNHVHGEPDRKDGEAMRFAMVQVNKYLWDNGLLNPDGEELGKCSAERMEQIIEGLKGVTE